jgi:menaquinol-cytochrome c reductase iron-sulfur subunit
MENKEQQETVHKPVKRKEMTRRQFLSYTLGGAGAFMAGGVILPMIRFAVDPLLQPKQEGNFVKVVEESKVTNEPLKVNFKVHQIDGWYESDPEMQAWIARDDNGKIYALSPVCKHLGCLVGWGGVDSPNQYHCPCHGAKYDRFGKNLTVAPKPLDEYQVKIENGWVYLGPLGPNQQVK